MAVFITGAALSDRKRCKNLGNNVRFTVLSEKLMYKFKIAVNQSTCRGASSQMYGNIFPKRGLKFRRHFF